MQILQINPNDLLELKKPHPCGDRRFRVIRSGSEVRIVCLTCGRDMVLDRVRLEKAVRRVIPAESPEPDDAENR